MSRVYGAKSVPRDQLSQTKSATEIVCVTWSEPEMIALSELRTPDDVLRYGKEMIARFR